jgi:hypothetical protein
MLLRHSGPLPPVYHQFADVVSSVCPCLMVRIVVVDPDNDLHVELAAVSALILRSKEQSKLAKSKWLSQNETT